MATIKGVCLLCLKKGVVMQAFNGHAKTVFEETTLRNRFSYGACYL